MRVAHMMDRFDFLDITPADFTKTLAFYRDLLCWQVLTDEMAANSSRKVMLSGGGIRILLRGFKTVGLHATPSTEPSRRSGLTLHLDIHDAHKRFAQIPSGEHIIKSPNLSESGELHFVLCDPDGTTLVFNELRQRS